MIGGTNTSLYRKFDEYIGVYADEMNVMLEEAISSAQLAEKNYNNHVNPDKNCYRFSN